MGTGELNARGDPAMNLHLIQWEVEILLVASCQRNQDKLGSDGPLGSYADLPTIHCRSVGCCKSRYRSLRAT